VEVYVAPQHTWAHIFSNGKSKMLEAYTPALLMCPFIRVHAPPNAHHGMPHTFERRALGDATNSAWAALKSLRLHNGMVIMHHTMRPVHASSHAACHPVPHRPAAPPSALNQALVPFLPSAPVVIRPRPLPSFAHAKPMPCTAPTLPLTLSCTSSHSQLCLPWPSAVVSRLPCFHPFLLLLFLRSVKLQSPNRTSQPCCTPRE
jgi:hypothetical protein